MKKCLYIIPFCANVGSGPQYHEQSNFVGQSDEPDHVLLAGEVVDPGGGFMRVPCDVPG